MSVAPELPIVDLPSRRRSDRASVIPFPRPRGGHAAPPRHAPARPPVRRGRGRVEPVVGQPSARSTLIRPADPATPEADPGTPAAGPQASPGHAQRHDGAGAARPEMTVVAGSARPFHLVTVPPPRRPVLIPGGRGAEPARPVAPVVRPAAPLARPAAPVTGFGPVRLTRRGRLVLVVLAAFVLAAVVTLVAPTVAQLRSATTVPASAPAVVVVQPGDTLWSIARRVAPDRDARLVVADLRRLNSLASADLEVGQRLTIRAG